MRRSGAGTALWKHPHGCGEDSPASSSSTNGSETPPRVWGRRLPQARYGLQAGNTPTGVGKTSDRRRRLLGIQKHPHGCGEDKRRRTALTVRQETPPRVWGRLCRAGLISSRGRNTPTGVGKTLHAYDDAGLEEKHPHGCGEDKVFQRVELIQVETPPRVWGRLLAYAVPWIPRRNTPTGVGKTKPAGMASLFSKKHPHGCGEDMPFPFSWLIRPETPPRVWGRLDITEKKNRLIRNTPTGVGKTGGGRGVC